MSIKMDIHKQIKTDRQTDTDSGKYRKRSPSQHAHTHARNSLYKLWYEISILVSYLFFMRPIVSRIQLLTKSSDP